MEYLALTTIGLVMGIFGGLLGIGGSSVMIPAMVLMFGENQHLYQAAAMICNFFVAAPAVIAHRKANGLVAGVLKYLIPVAAVGIVIGVAVSNSSIFAARNSYLLARAFGGFLVYVAIYNCFKFRRKNRPLGTDIANPNASVGPQRLPWLSALTGMLTGLGAGMLGIGAGTISTPMQQIFMKMPMKKAMSNSAATITAIALIGALYKNLTLPAHGIEITESLRIAGIIIPTAMIGGYIGGHLMHKLPKNIVRVIFIILVLLAAAKMITARPHI